LLCLVPALYSGMPANRAIVPIFSGNRPVFSGSPYFDENYKYADIFLSKTRKFTSVKTRIDLETQSVQFISEGVEGMLQPGWVKEVSYADTTSDGILFYKFRTGYPPFENKTAQQFYIVMADGNCSMLRAVEKRVINRKNAITGDVVKDYETYDNFYLFVKGEMKRLKRDREYIMAELADRKVQVDEFVDKNRINFRNTDQVAKLINYYNTL